MGSLLGWEDPLEEETATHSNTIVWRISWTSEPGGLQYTGLQRVRHDWSDLACTRGNTKNNNSKNQWFPGVIGEGRINRWGTEDFQGSETTPHGTVKADAGNYKCVQWQIVQHWGWTLTHTTDFEWQWRINTGSQTVTKVLSGAGCSWWGHHAFLGVQSLSPG